MNVHKNYLLKFYPNLLPISLSVRMKIAVNLRYSEEGLVNKVNN